MTFQIGMPVVFVGAGSSHRLTGTVFGVEAGVVGVDFPDHYEDCLPEELAIAGGIPVARAGSPAGVGHTVEPTCQHSDGTGMHVTTVRWADGIITSTSTAGLRYVRPPIGPTASDAAANIRGWLNFDYTNHDGNVSDRLGVSYETHPLTRSDLEAVLDDNDTLRKHQQELRNELVKLVEDNARTVRAAAGANIDTAGPRTTTMRGRWRR